MSDAISIGKKQKILEEDLCEPVARFLINNGYTVRSEVKYCDITALRDNELIVVELKRNLSVDLLVQAVKRQKAADLVYIAVPKPKRIIGNTKWKDLCHLLRRLELGLILVSFKDSESFVEIPIEPVYFNREKSKAINRKKRENIIKEINGRYCDLNIGGSTRKKLITAYKESAIFIACLLNKYGALSPKELKKFGTDNKKTNSILSENYYGWFNKVKKGIYEINDAGKKALGEFKDLAEFYNGRI